MKASHILIAASVLLAGLNFASANTQSDDTVGEPWTKFELDSHAIAVLMKSEKIASRLREGGAIQRIRQSHDDIFLVTAKNCALTARYEQVECPGDESALNCGEEPLFCTRVTVLNVTGKCK